MRDSTLHPSTAIPLNGKRHETTACGTLVTNAPSEPLQQALLGLRGSFSCERGCAHSPVPAPPISGPVWEYSKSADHPEQKMHTAEDLAVPVHRPIHQRTSRFTSS